MTILEGLVRTFGVPLVKRLPDKLLRKFALRYYVEGDARKAIEAMKPFRQRRVNPIFDILGEDVNDDFVARRNKEDYISLMQEISDEDLLYKTQENTFFGDYSPEISIKLSMLGLPGNCDDDSKFLFVQEQVTEILKEAQRRNIFVRIDMEDLRYTDRTLLMYKNLREKGFDDVGVVLQSRLIRTEEDLLGLLYFEPDVRLVKGAYHNEDPSQILSSEEKVSNNFIDLECILLSSGLPVEIASMDLDIINTSALLIATYKNENPIYSFSMLYGARDDELFRLADEGYPTKIYIPYGTFEKAKAYALRRFDENPSLVLEILKNEIKDRKLDL